MILIKHGYHIPPYQAKISYIPIIKFGVPRGVSRGGLRGLEHPPSLPDFTEIHVLPICLQLLFFTFTFVLMTQYIRLYLCSVKEKMKL